MSSSQNQAIVTLGGALLGECRVSVIHSEDEAAAALSSEDTVLIAVSVTRQRKHVDTRIERILKKQMGELKRGRQVRNPKLSAAR